MMCNCGGYVRDRYHQVKTLETAITWDKSVTEDDLPVMVSQHECIACGRNMVSVRRNAYDALHHSQHMTRRQ